MLVLVFSMILSVVGCAKKPIDLKKFKDIMENDFNCDVEQHIIDGIDMEAYLQSMGIKEKYYASVGSEADVNFILFEDTDRAELWFEDSIEYYEDNDDFKVNKSGSGNYMKVVIKSTNDDEIAGIYLVYIRSETMVITLRNWNFKDKEIKKANNIIKRLGY